MKIFKITLSVFLLLILASCLKSDVCECSTFDPNGDFLYLISKQVDVNSNCNSEEIFITDSGDTNTIICQTVKR